MIWEIITIKQYSDGITIYNLNHLPTAAGFLARVFRFLKSLIGNCAMENDHLIGRKQMEV